VNTAKQVNVMLGLLFVGLFATFLYFLYDNGFNAFGIDFDGRETAAAERQEKTNVERGAALFSTNCSSCHGLTGQGALERVGLPGAALNVEGYRPPGATATEVSQLQSRFMDTIECGRVGTVMPPWHIDNGGALNSFQIEQLVLLITSEFSPEGWEHAFEEANHSAQFDPRIYLSSAISADDTTLSVTGTGGMAAEGLLRIGGDEMDEPYEIMLITEVDADNDEVTVERGVQGSQGMEHEEGEEVRNGPIPPGDTIIGAGEGTPPCGQNPVSGGGGGGDEVEVSGEAEMDMDDNVFVLDGAENPTLLVAAGDTVTINLSNVGTAIHNMRIASLDGEYMTDDDFVSDPDTIVGGESGVIEFSFDDPGAYLYQCDFHTNQMLGEITVQ